MRLLLDTHVFTPILQKQIERLHQLPKTQQKVVMQMLDGVLTQASR